MSIDATNNGTEIPNVRGKDTVISLHILYSNTTWMVVGGRRTRWGMTIEETIASGVELVARGPSIPKEWSPLEDWGLLCSHMNSFDLSL